MAPAITQIAPGRLEVREGGGCLSLFGLPFFCAGLAVMLITFGIIPLSNADDVQWYAWPIMLMMGAVFTAVGGVLMFGRTWTTFSTADRTVVVQYGLIVPMRAKTYSIGDDSTVVIDFHRGDSDTADQYPVSLKARSGINLRLFGSTNYAESRERATAVAGLFNFDIEDATTDHPTRLTPAQASLPLTLRARMEHFKAEPLTRPGVMAADVIDSADAVRIVIPNPRPHIALFLFFAIPIAAPVFLFGPFSDFFRQSKTPDGVAWVFLGFLVLAFGMLPAWSGGHAYLKSRRGRTTITASTSGIRVEERGVWKTWTVATLAADDILDIDYSTRDSMLISARKSAEDVVRQRPAMATAQVGPRTERALAALSRFAKSGGVTIKTRHGLTTFAAGLADEEVQYLHSVVKGALLR